MSTTRNGVILNPCQLLHAKPVELLDGSQTKVVEGHGQVRRLSRRRSEVPSVIVEVNMILDPEEEEDLAQQKLDPNKRLSFFKRYLGIFFALMSSIVFSMTTLIVKVLSARYHAFNLGFWRFQGIMIPGILCLLYQHLFVEKSNVFGSVLLSKPGSKKTIVLLLFRSLMGCTAIWFQFFALRFISVADASVIGFSTPILITILAYFVLHEAFSFVQMGVSCFSLIGVFIIARPPFLTGSEEFDMDTLIGTGLSLGCMVGTTIVFICLRFLRETHYLLTTVIFGIWGSLQCLIAALSMGLFQLPMGLTDWGLGLSLAFLTFFGQTLITLALQYEQSGIVSLIRCLDVVFSFIYQFIFLGVSPDLYSVGGALFVVLSVMIIGFRKWVYELPEEHSTRRRLRLILK